MVAVSRKTSKQLNFVFSGLRILALTDDKIFKPFKFRMEEIEGFRYRAQDALRAVTKTSGKI